MSALGFNCSSCGMELEADSTLAGKIIKCPQCSQAIKVPKVELISPGMVLGGYVLNKLLGKGGMGEVWLATQNSVGRKVALKILAPALSKDQEFIARFSQEMRTVAKLDHHGIVSAYEAGYDKDFYFFATSYVDGATLESTLDSGKTFCEKEALAVGRKVAEALEYAWDRHMILHRDIKPANIIVEKGGEVRLMDMGISKNLREDNSITKTGTIFGTPYYMSPEQAKGEKDIDFRTDIYSLGATLYHMLTGQVPHNATSTMGILVGVISEPATPIRKLNTKISLNCEALISKMMDKDKHLRQSTWQDVIEDIGIITDGQIAGSAAGRWLDWSLLAKHERFFKLAAVCLAALCVVLLSVFFLDMRGRKTANEDEDLMDIIREGTMDPFEHGNTAAKSSFVEHPVVKKSEATEKKTVEKNDEAQNPKISNKADPVHSAPAPAEEIPRKHPLPHPVFMTQILQKIPLNENEIKKITPILENYSRRLRQIRDDKPANGYTYAELKDKVGIITSDMEGKLETVLTKEKALKLVEMLKENRRRHFLNYTDNPR